jgi:hypothetical protein
VLGSYRAANKNIQTKNVDVGKELVHWPFTNIFGHIKKSRPSVRAQRIISYSVYFIFNNNTDITAQQTQSYIII